MLLCQPTDTVPAGAKPIKGIDSSKTMTATVYSIVLHALPLPTMQSIYCQYSMEICDVLLRCVAVSWIRLRICSAVKESTRIGNVDRRNLRSSRPMESNVKYSPWM